MTNLGLVEKRECRTLTWRGRGLVLLGMIALAIFGILSISPFLAVTAPVQDELLVVEGWIPDYALEQAITQFHHHPYRLLVTTGGALQEGSRLVTYRTNAELAAAILKQAGFDARLLTAVPSPPGLTKDRTYGSAVALRNWLRNAYPELKQLDVLTLGTHSRRTRLLFQKALGDSIRVGIIAVQDRDFDPDRWWMSSSGFRTVLDEGIAYFYARFLFHPDT